MKEQFEQEVLKKYSGYDIKYDLQNYTIEVKNGHVKYISISVNTYGKELDTVPDDVFNRAKFFFGVIEWAKSNPEIDETDIARFDYNDTNIHVQKFSAHNSITLYEFVNSKIQSVIYTCESKTISIMDSGSFIQKHIEDGTVTSEDLLGMLNKHAPSHPKPKNSSLLYFTAIAATAVGLLAVAEQKFGIMSHIARYLGGEQEPQEQSTQI